MWLLILFVLITAFLPDISLIVVDNTREAKNQYVRDLKIRQTKKYSVEAQNDAFNMDEIKSNSTSNPNQVRFFLKKINDTKFEFEFEFFFNLRELLNHRL